MKNRLKNYIESQNIKEKKNKYKLKTFWILRGECKS